MSSVDVVISGIGGYFPNSRNVMEFSKNLQAGQSLLSRVERWPIGMMGTPELCGFAPEADKFDHTFFGMHIELSKRSDAQTRVAIKTAFEAIIDAGMCPSEIRGSNAQVYSASAQSENDCCLSNLGEKKTTGYVIMGKNRCMSANRISYCLHLSGRSCAYDASSGWLGTGLALAREAIQSGECDTVFVTAVSLLMLAPVTKQRQNMGLISPENTCRPYDVEANGVPRGEAQITFLVQRADKAKRSYGSIVFAGGETESFLPNWFLSVNDDHLRNFISSAYRDNGIDPNKVQLLEVDGLAIKEMIETELNVLDEVLNKKRPKNSPLFIGTVKSITGDTEGAAGHTALTKLILAMETGIISPTIDCKNINPNLRGLAEGRLKVVTEPTKWEVTPDTHVAVSTISVTGLVSHVVLKANGKAKDKNLHNNNPYPYLIVMSGRQPDFVKESLQEVASTPFDPEYIRLTQEVFANHIDKFEYRGFGFHGQDESQNFVIQRYNRRPVWFVYSGMGSQWPGMGRDLMLIPIIRETFERLHKILKPKGVDLINILTSFEVNIFDNILHSFLGIAATQIALTNLLKLLGIVPEGIIGHSVGELGCSYADECLTEEQTILAAYERGMASLKADLIPGLMAAVGVGYSKAKDLLPEDVYVACRNSKDSCTISGPTESVKKVIASLEKQAIFVRGVNVSNIAYHSPYIQPAAPHLYKSLRKVIPSPKLRSSKWICTSAPKEKWDSDEVRYCSAEYHTNNLLGAVLFEEGSSYIPADALVIEVAPHGLLQAILKRSLGNEVAHVPLTRRGTPSPSRFLIEAIGMLFLAGQSPKIWHLYPDVEMPVSRNTPSLVPLIKWEHPESFPYLVGDHIEDYGEFSSLELNHNSCPNMEIGSIKCLPVANALVLVYRRMKELMGPQYNNLQVIFEDVFFYDLIKFDTQDVAKVSVTILQKSGIFRISKDETQVAKGKIRVVVDGYEAKKLPSVQGPVEYSLNSDEIYSELKTRGVVLPDELKTIEDVEIRQLDWIANIPFGEDWATVINSLVLLFQLEADNADHKPESVCKIQQLIIDPALKDVFDTSARYHLPTRTVVYPGITMTGAEFRAVDTIVDTKPVALRFVPFGQSALGDEALFLSSVLHLISEKRWHESSLIKICDIDGEFTSITNKLHDLLKSNFVETATPKDADLIVCGSSSILALAPVLASSNNLLLSRCSRKEFDSTLKEIGLHVVAECCDDGLVAITSLLPPIQPSDCQVFKMKPQDSLPTALENPKHSFVIFVWENDTLQPIEQILSDIKNTGCPEKIRLVFLMTPNAPSFSMSLPLYANQLRLNMPLNIYMDGKWGSYHLLGVPESHQLGQNGHKDLAIKPDVVLKDRDSNIVKLNPMGIKIHDLSNYKYRPAGSKEAVIYCTKYSAHASIMGVASWDNHCSYFVPDPILFWSVTEEWSSGNGPSVLFSYALAYYILFDVGNLGAKKSILISCPLTFLGQAVIRIAKSLNCDIVILVASSHEEEQVRNLFPKLNAKIIVSATDSFSCSLKVSYPEGVHVIVSDLTGSRLRASTQCVHEFGNIVQIDEDAMLIPDYIGTNFFLRAVAVYGVTQHTILNASPEVKKRIQEWVDEGLESGVVAPGVKKSVPISMNGSVVNGKSKTQHESNYHEKTNGHYAKENESNDLSKSIKTQRDGAVIVGGSKAQWVRLSYSLAKKGCKIVALVQENPSPNLVIRHSKILHREFDTELRDLTSVRSGADLIKSDLGNLRSIFVFGNNTFAEEVVHELDAKGLKDVPLLFFSKNSAYFSRMCERWSQNGLKVRAALGVEDAPTCKRTLDWLLSPAASTVSVLNEQAFLGSKSGGTSLSEADMLPTSDIELQALGSAIRKQTSPIFREIVTCGRKVRDNGEVQPIFFIKGLHGSANSELLNLATGLLGPLVEVTLHGVCGSLEAAAASVVQGIQRIQNNGPYNLSGDAIRSEVVIKVARMLEEKGFASVVFLMNEEIRSIREDLKVLQKSNRLGDSLLKATLSDTIEPTAWRDIYLNNLPWNKQVETVVSKVPSLNMEHRDDVVSALHHIYDSMQHIVESQEKTVLKHGIVRYLKRGDDYRTFEMTSRSIEYYIPSAKLKRKELADILSPLLATPILQLELDRVLRR